MSGKQDDEAAAADLPRIIVVGSLNMDLVTRVARLPRAGETVKAEDLLRIPGGKGANQAVAAARLGARCSMIGRVGDDDFGQQLRSALQSCGVDVAGVATTANCTSGVALIGVDEDGQNSITVVAGANGRLSPDDVDRHAALLEGASALLVQLEVPYETVQRALKHARRYGVRTILDPAPAPQSSLPEPLWDVDLLSPNESEAERLAGEAVGDLRDAERVARRLRRLRRRGPRQVVLKLGHRGAMVCDEQNLCTHVPAPRVEPVDTTAAGDAFTAAMAVTLAGESELADAVRFACYAGALAATRPGAQPSMPGREDVEHLMNSERGTV